MVATLAARCLALPLGLNPSTSTKSTRRTELGVGALGLAARRLALPLGVVRAVACFARGARGARLLLIRLLLCFLVAPCVAFGLLNARSLFLVDVWV